jgi:V-type H+-transporting ATPase subunit B
MKDPRIDESEAAKLNAAAAVRNYGVHPRLDYRTVSAINGPVSRAELLFLFVWLV